MNKVRPKYLALHQIKLPLPGIVSIFHRVSGVLLFLALPLLLWTFEQSLRSPQTHHALTECLSSAWIKLPLLVLLWAFLHHFCAGLRYLSIDLHLVSNLSAARSSSKWVLFVSAILTLLLGVRLW